MWNGSHQGLALILFFTGCVSLDKKHSLSEDWGHGPPLRRLLHSTIPRAQINAWWDGSLSVTPAHKGGDGISGESGLALESCHTSEPRVFLRMILDISFSLTVHVHTCAEHPRHKQMCMHACVDSDTKSGREISSLLP